MTATVVSFPEKTSKPDAAGMVPTRMLTEPAIRAKLETLATRANCTPGQMAEALVVFGMALIERKDPEAFFKSLPRLEPREIPFR